MITLDLLPLFEDKMFPLMTNTNKTFTTSEIQRFLNNAQDLYIENLADVYEVDEKTRRALTSITKSLSETTVSAPSGVVPLSDSSVFVQTSTMANLMRIVEEQAIDSDDNRIKIKPITHDQYLANINNPFKQPYDKLVWRVDVDEAIELVPDDSTTISTYEVRYLEKPATLDFDSVTVLTLPDYILKTIVDMAVKMAVNSLYVGRQQEK